MPPKQRALEKQATLEAERERKAIEEQEKKEAAEWSVGAKDNSRTKQNEDKEAERLRKEAEKAALLAQEDAELGTVKTVKKTKKKGKDDFDLLNAALASAPKSKAQKEAELKAQEAEERKKEEAKKREAKQARLKSQEDEVRKAAAKGIVINHTDELMVPINNRLPDDEDEDGFEDISGLENAISALSTGGSLDEHPERRQKALYNAFYAANLPRMREEFPGLKLSQYKERIFEEWQHSPENPRNAQR